MTQYYHLFPFEKVKKGSRLVLYGAGEVGQWYLAQLRKSGYAEVVAIADQNWERYPGMGVPLVAPAVIPSLDFDDVLVSIEDQTVACKVRKMLEQEYQIESQRIILGSDSLDMIPTFFKVGMKKLPPPRFPDDRIPIAVCLAGGMGDFLIHKRKLEEILHWDSRIVIDCFVNDAMLSAMHSFFDGEYQGRIHDIISGGRPQYLMQREYYAAAMELMLDVDDVLINQSRLKAAPKLLRQIRKLQKEAESYGHIDPGHFPLHYMRCKKDGLNCYTSFNRYIGFDVRDWHTHVPLQEQWEESFHALHLPNQYITVNYGFERHGDAMNCKGWPLERFAEVVRMCKESFPEIAVVQVGGKGFPEIPGCDVHILGQSLELVKYVLKASMLHIDIEGGLVHLATQLGTRCVVLFGPTPLHYYAYKENINLQAGNCHNCIWYQGSNWRCYRHMKEPECMYAITPELVMEHVEKELRERGL